MFYFIVITLLTLGCPVVADTILNGDLTQGGIVFGKTKPGFEITFDGKPIRVSSEGYFLLGFSRDAKTDSELIIRDLGSKHGTYVNESPIDETTIESGDELRIGITRFVVEIPKE